MKKATLIIILLTTIFGLSTSLSAQQNPDPLLQRDPLMEADAKHNLDVAWQAFRLKKAYKGVLLRFEETFAAYPDFSKMDEFLYLAGMSCYYLSENKGKQKVDLKSERDKEKYNPQKMRQEAELYFGLIIEKYPDSKYIDEARQMLEKLRNPR
ncbi:MAG TPA: outer membrane protein assembly factor BamD [Pyrinomonadaceae bacterium]|jgi:outer membrane protein assembly factor BamD (BamD/ComL family)|nr:outer membrane protein assembly factor BamD [Pyrinomonadaceae bacterium]